MCETATVGIQGPQIKFTCCSSERNWRTDDKPRSGEMLAPSHSGVIDEVRRHSSREELNDPPTLDGLLLALGKRESRDSTCEVPHNVSRKLQLTLCAIMAS